ncbi:MAG: 1-acyl-sn-glycerol-3-phosphate acyltransferase [Actinobacteria bacterium]|nr:1-acyl-sn-glycerol-3-phosphate acyltransferase [Actinomycetota bacterium]MBU1866115.1 1-acyl-sn-glycerol-3-phosphate acyltransferase [Actinomycetota bacterium]
MSRVLPTHPPRFTVFDTPILRSILRLVGVTLLWVKRWRTSVRLPDTPSWVAVIAPHTSFWDFPLLVSLALKHRIKANWLGKHTLFRGPFFYFFRWLGGIPVDPADSGDGRVAGVVRMFEENDRMRIGIAPEAGLSPVTTWRTGFYHIANGAQVPLLLAYVDYGRRIVGADTWFVPTGDMAADFARLGEFYGGKRPRYPERFALPEV